MMKRAFALALAILLAPSTVLALGPAFWGESFTPPAAPAYTPQAVTFPTSADYLEYVGESFASDSDVITIAMTFETPASFPSGLRNLYALSNRIQIVKDATTDKLSIDLRNAANSVIYFKTSVAALDVSTKYCLLFSARLDGTPVAHFYLNGSNVADTGGTDPTTGMIDFTRTAGETIPTYPGVSGQHLTGLKVGPFWMGQQYVNFSTPANVSAFCDGADPIYWGADGSTPTGVQPGRVNYWPASGGRLVGVGSLSPSKDFSAAGSPTYGDW